ncbi:hypothetical protein LCGC14_2989950 [marine sediment metagenome]|uniref:Uncharacterized protein n=1 Tax=marine sediment metagenome TaxID=412755 RepID=A0A0F8ZBP7_9ZZZZ
MRFRKKAGFLECAGCGCLMRRARKTVDMEDRAGFPTGTGGGSVYYTGAQYSTESYCGICIPAYDMRRVTDKVHYYRTEPAYNVEVTEEGKPIKGGE